jgi:hypothetical protein
LWQSILRQAFPLVRELYLALTIAERMRFDRDYSTFFFAHAATQPPINAEKMLALLRIGVVSLVKLGNNYRFTKKASGLGYDFVYGENELVRTGFRYVVDARGQERSVRTDASQLYRNLILRKTIHLGEIHPTQKRGPDQAAIPGSAPAKSHEVATESVWIDPNTHRIMQVDPRGTVRKSRYFYAVGAMTRGQIIDVSMARGLTRSTDRIAEQLVNWLIRHPVDRAGDDSIRSSE